MYQLPKKPSRRQRTFLKLTGAMVATSSASIGCSQEPSAMAGVANAPSKSRVAAAKDTKGNRSNKMKITIGSKTFAATLFDNATATAFKARLPLTLDMDELNGNEKKFDFLKFLPTDSFSPRTINNGDLMIWGSQTLVLFYKSFPTHYPYTRLGRIDDPAGLEAAVGSGNVKVTFAAG